MKPLPAGVFNCLLIMAVIVSLYSCARKEDYPYEPYSVASRIVSVTGPPTAKAGEQVVITVGIRNDQSLCSEDAEAWYDHIGADTLRISGALRAVADRGKCRQCRKDAVLYTLLYFTPAGKGTYHIIAAGDTSVSSTNGDALRYRVTVN